MTTTSKTRYLESKRRTFCWVLEYSLGMKCEQKASSRNRPSKYFNSYNNVKQDISMMIPISVFKLYTRIRGIFLFPYKFTLLSYFECTYLRKLKQLSVGLSCYISIRRVKFDRDHIYKSFPRDWKFNSYRKISSAASGKLR